MVDISAAVVLTADCVTLRPLAVLVPRRSRGLPLSPFSRLSLPQRLQGRKISAPAFALHGVLGGGGSPSSSPANGRYHADSVTPDTPRSLPAGSPSACEGKRWHGSSSGLRIDTAKANRRREAEGFPHPPSLARTGGRPCCCNSSDVAMGANAADDGTPVFSRGCESSSASLLSHTPPVLAVRKRPLRCPLN